MLSSTQEGFRKQKETMWQLQNVMNIMSHARNKPAMLYLDFSSAFNNMHHDKLLCIKHDLGLPTDAIKLTAKLYANAITKTKLCLTETGTTKIERGTAQGDT